MNAFWAALDPLWADAWLVVYYGFPFFLPVVLAVFFWPLWVRYVRNLAFSTMKYSLLEVRLPQEIMKSPRAMEIVLNAFYNTGGEGNFIDRYWKGQTRPWFSLELVSDGGHVRFLIWTRDNLRNFIESQIYAQYPEVEIHQVPDYAAAVEFDPKVNNMWGMRFELAADQTLPIPTYVDFGLDKDPKEEYKLDPLAQTLELLSSVKPGEHIWFQIVIRAHKNEKREGVFSKASDWRAGITKTRNSIFERIKKEERGRPSSAETALLDSLGRAYQKYPFDVGMRAIYFADTTAQYNQGTAGSVGNLLRPFSFGASVFKKSFEGDSFAGLNGFKSADVTAVEYPWMDFRKSTSNKKKEEMLDHFKRRSFFHEPYKEKTFVLTSEALATIYHFPGAIVTAPGLERIPSTRAQAPSNLPV